MAISRREFLKRTGVAAAGLTVASIGGLDVKPVQARVNSIKLNAKKGKQYPSVCPYCSVGCGMIITSDEKTGQIINIEGNPDSPVNLGSLCPKGAAAFQLVHNEHRQKKVLYRAPGATKWEEKPLDWAYEQIAKRVKETRDKTFVETYEGKKVNMTPGIAALGGSTMENEWNYLWAKLMRSLGVVNIENQARI
ncbi:formate dehydrogenase [Effusibacillus lacus]|uniref:Formate dehydrogenase n=2 Tax=Effusibacillus lacus TaxID=1348429 RepID=A0A292YNI5_9BACL|nr:twin-arginine translocation signal domain-containing protein [Effusibacillus lacus]TCS71424.1 formate dehydrogenase major subunit [Effusibacillus lacus]GAX89954.1 formate dehydrogenase [Effusibacillus lacus]